MKKSPNQKSPDKTLMVCRIPEIVIKQQYYNHTVEESRRKFETYVKEQKLKIAKELLIAQDLPQTVEECLLLITSKKYKSLGFGVVSLDYVYGFSLPWRISFRNPSDFENPNTASESPLEACHKMLLFLKTLKINQDEL